MKYSMLLHGFLTLLIGNLAGVGYSMSIRKIIRNDAGWRLLHTACMMGGIMLMVFAVFIDDLTKGFKYADLIYYSIIISNYSFTAGMLLAALTAKRGLDKNEKGSANMIVYILYYIASLLSLVYTILFIYLLIIKVI